MARHGNPAVGRQYPAPRPGIPYASLRAVSPRGRGPSVATSGSFLVAAVAAGALVPAVQALDTHVADASSTTSELNTADLSLASQHTVAQPAVAHRAPGGAGVASVVMPQSAPSTGASAGDADDVASLTKAISVSRENGPLEFGTPYQAGNDSTLNGQIAKALGLMGLPQRLAPGVKKIIMRESTGNADAVNDWDSNASAGTPSKGLMQLIDTTFRNAVLPSLADKGIFDPVANITAGVRTMVANHGLDAVLDGGLRSASGGYIGYGGAKLPSDGLGRAD